MSTKVRFGNKIIQLPGSYSRIVSGQNNPPRELDYGKLLIIDNEDLNATVTGGMLGGAGIAGTLASGKDAIYRMKDINEFRDFVGYGWWWKAAEGLFNPDGQGRGVSEVIVVKPATTTPAVMTFTATGGGAAGGSFKVKTRDESVAANGVSTTALTSGYGFSVSTGLQNANKWILKIWRGTYKGLYTDGISYDEVLSANSKPILIAQSPEFDNIQTLIDWAKSDTQFGKYFVLDTTSAVVGLGTVTTADISTLPAYTLAAGATATYDAMDAALDAIKDLDYNAILTTSSTATPGSDTDILKIKVHITTEAKYDKHLYIAGHDTTPATSIAQAVLLNSEKIILVHGSIKKVSNKVAGGFRIWESFFHAAYAVGLALGLPPQVPTTFKPMNIDGLGKQLNQKELEALDEGGVWTTYFDEDLGRFVCLHDVNTLQDNEFVLNDNGSSHLIQIERIKQQLNKELIIGSKQAFMTDPAGLNKTSISKEDAIEWTKSFLQRKVDSKTLLVGWRNVTAVYNEDTIWVDYEASPNSEIKGIFFTGRLYL